jgi:hypothetical protein
MRCLLLLVGLLPFVAGCEEKAPSQNGPKAVTVKTTGGTTQ